MSLDESRNRPPDPIEEGLRRRLRIVVVGVLLSCVVLSVLVDTFGRLFIDPNFHSSDVLFGTMIGAITLLLGVEGFNRLPKGKL